VLLVNVFTADLLLLRIKRADCDRYGRIQLFCVRLKMAICSDSNYIDADEAAALIVNSEMTLLSCLALLRRA
jgi:hypothetical protein